MVHITASDLQKIPTKKAPKHDRTQDNRIDEDGDMSKLAVSAEHDPRTFVLHFVFMSFVTWRGRVTMLIHHTASCPASFIMLL
jgi:hypothetical protein